MGTWLFVALMASNSRKFVWHSDFSGLPLSKRRAYGRLIKTTFTCQDATIKKLKPIQFLNQNREVTQEIPMYALTLNGGQGASVVIYFTRKPGQSLERFEYRHHPADRPQKCSGLLGVTTAQFIAPDPKSGQPQSRMYRENFSTRLVLGSPMGDRLTGSIIMVFPDSSRSFVSGSFKARPVGF